MKLLKSKTWQHETTGDAGNTMLFGVNIFDYEWKDTKESVLVRHPLFDQEYKFHIYSVVINGQEQKFAAGEFSNLVWGFYIFKY